MDFFDDLGKKITQVGQTAVQKTKDLTDVAKINGLISEEEKKAENLYLQIGKLYAKKHRIDSEPEFANLVSAVCGSEDKIKEYKKQIMDIKGISRCKKCGSELAENAIFCSICGTPVSAPTEKKCPKCGAVMAKEMRFCTSCGTPLEAPAKENAPETPAPAPEAPTPAPAEEPAEKKCPKCGALMANEMHFCTECGTPLEAPAKENAPEISAPAPEAPTPALEETEFAPETLASAEEPAEKKCPNCGTVPGEGMAFCTECGIKLN